MREEFGCSLAAPFGRLLAALSEMATLRWLRIFSESDFFSLA